MTLDPTDPLVLEHCFPGGLNGEADVGCPNCEAQCTVPVDEPNASESYRCRGCGQGLVVNWADWNAQA